MKQTAILIIILIILAVVTGYAYIKSNQITQNLTVIPSPSATLPPSNPVQDENRYTNPNGVYTFLYPNDFQIDSQNNGQMVRVYKQGPTQKGQTEMYDGVIVHFENVDLGELTLSDWVDERITQSTADGTSEIITPKEVTALNNYPGFTFTLRGLGTSEYIVIQKDANSSNAIVITTLVADPGNLGFQQKVNEILSTLQILK